MSHNMDQNLGLNAVTPLRHRGAIKCNRGKLLSLTIITVVLMSLCACTSNAQTTERDGLCSSAEMSTVSYLQTYQASRSQRTAVKCGFFNWGRCTRYRTTYYTESRVAYRDISNLVFNCCPGWTAQPDGSCLSDATESPFMPPSTVANETAPMPTDNSSTPVHAGDSSTSSSVSTSGATGTGSPPGEIAGPGGQDGLNPPGKGGFIDGETADPERVGMIGGVVGVALALVVMVSLMIFFVSRKKRQAREKRKPPDPGVIFQLLSSSSPLSSPTPDIYTEIPDRDSSPSSDGLAVGSSGQKILDEYDVAFMPSQQGASNTYQDLKGAAGGRRAAHKGDDGGGSLAKNKPVRDMEVRLGQNGAVFTKVRDDRAEEDPESGTVYQNVPSLDTVIQPPDIYDTVGTNAVAPRSYNHLDRTNSKPAAVIPTDPDDESYNMIIIGPGPQNDENKRYDKLDRQRGTSHIAADGQLDTQIPVAPGYLALGADTRQGYDKLERHEAHGVPDTEQRKAGNSTGPNTYSELGAQGRPADYDKLNRRHSDDQCLDSAGVSTATTGPNSAASKGNEYDTIEVGKPADGEIYENLPKKPSRNGVGLTIKTQPKDMGSIKQANSDTPPASSPAQPQPEQIARPVYDVIPRSPRRLSAPVYDIVPISPTRTDAGGSCTTPVYDTPPVVLKPAPFASDEDQRSPELEGVKPVYDTPPVRYPLQFEETCPVYENTPTTRR